MVIEKITQVTDRQKLWAMMATFQDEIVGDQWSSKKIPGDIRRLMGCRLATVFPDAFHQQQPFLSDVVGHDFFEVFKGTRVLNAMSGVN